MVMAIPAQDQLLNYSIWLKWESTDLELVFLKLSLSTCPSSWKICIVHHLESHGLFRFNKGTHTHTHTKYVLYLIGSIRVSFTMLHISTPSFTLYTFAEGNKGKYLCFGLSAANISRLKQLPAGYICICQIRREARGGSGKNRGELFLIISDLWRSTAIFSLQVDEHYHLGHSFYLDKINCRLALVYLLI